MNVPTSRAHRAPFALLCTVAFALPAQAGHEAATDRNPEQITVLGRRITPTAPGAAAARQEAARVPGGASVVGAEEYAGSRASNLLDVLALTPGVFIQPRFGAEEARLSIRGSGLQRTFHLRGINLLQDGVPITLADGSADFQAVEPLALAYTEVLRGGNALEYGGTTLGGSINFVSPSGHDGGGLRSRLEGGSFGYRRALAGFGGLLGQGDYFVTASASAQDGFRDWSEQQNERLFGNLGVQLREGVATRFFFSAVQSDSQLPGALTRAQLAADPEAANPGSLAGRQKRDFDLYRLANLTVLEFDRRALELSFGYAYKDLWHPIFQLLEQRSHDYSAGIRYVDERALGGRDNRLIVGFAPSWNRIADDRFVNVAGQPGAPTASSRQRAQNFVLYAQDELDAGRDLTVILGAQWAQAERRYDDRFLSNGDQGFDASYTRLSPKAGFLWQPRESLAVFGNVSDSFEPPSFGELAGGPGVDLLDAQTARTVELGARGHAARVQWDVAVYAARVRDELLSLNAPGGQPLGTVNAPRTLHRGLELGAEVALGSAVSWRSSYLWSDFRFDDDPTYGDNDLPGIPEHFYRGELSWAPRPDHFVALTTEWSPRRYPIDMANSWSAGSYALWGVKLGRTVETGWSWFVEGRNLGDRHYAATTGVIADARGQDVAQFYPGDGRAVYAGVAWRAR